MAGLGRGRKKLVASSEGDSRSTSGVNTVAEHMEQLTLEKQTSSGSERAEIKQQNICGMLHDFTWTRPANVEKKTGSSGREISLRANFIPVQSLPNWLLYQYHVKFEPLVDSKAARQKMVLEHPALQHLDQPVFDGMILYLALELTSKEQLNLEATCPNSGETVSMTLKLTNRLAPDSPQCLTVLNLCNRRAFQLMSYHQFGRHYFNPQGAHTIEKHGLELWPGLISAIRCYEQELLLGMETTHKVLRVDSVRDFMFRMYSENKTEFKEKTNHELIGTSVMTKYNNKTYRVDDIMWDMNPRSQFEQADGSKINFVEYYSNHYGIVIKEMEQPLLLSRAKRRGPEGEGPRDLFLIPELSTMTGLTDAMRSDQNVMKELAIFTRVTPDKRVAEARKHLQSLKASGEARKLFSDWNLELGQDLVVVKGRVLPPETLSIGKNRKFSYNASIADWGRELKGLPLLDPKPMQNWVLIYFEREKAAAEEFFLEMKRMGGQVGMRVDQPRVEGVGERISDYVEALRQLITPKTDIVLVIVPNDNKNRYDAIKKECCLENPVPSQVVLAATLLKKKILQSICAKVLLQMNCKMGGSLWTLNIPMKQVMVIGYDSYHDSSERGKTVGAAVFSMDPDLAHWYSQCEVHSNSTELINNLAEFFRKAMKKYKELNGYLPNRVFLFRDGVGEGQIPVVYNVEMPEILKVFKEAYGHNYKDQMKFSFIIVTKRVNTRFFAEDPNGSMANPPPGTIVDTVVTRRERYDFYMIPQRVNQGTVTPVSYNIIYDRNGLNPDRMQTFAYKLCHLYYNWQGTIRVPAPCQYAHKLAFLVSQSLHHPGDESIQDKLYFL